MKKTITAVVVTSCIASFSLAFALGADEATSLKAAVRSSKLLSMAAREKAVDLGYEAFKKKVYKESFPGGVYIVNGDTPVADEKELMDFYQREIVAEWKSIKFGVALGEGAVTQLILDAPNGNPAAWDNVNKKNLTYCISKTFGDNYTKTKQAIQSATQAWEAVADVRFVHVDSLDEKCDANTPGVVFDVRPVNVGGEYLARAFFPRYARAQRNVLIDDSSFVLKPGKLELVGILRHELGHTLGYRHEQTRPEAGKCFEDKNWVPLTSYDAFSVMHYPQCNGLGDWSLSLTEKDKLGAACLYGPANGSAFDPASCGRI